LAAVASGVYRDAALAPLTTLAIGGPARCLVVPRSLDELAAVLEVLRRDGGRFFVLGAGSNVLFPDAGFAGTVVLTTRLDRCRALEGAVGAACGARWSQLLALPEVQTAASLDFLVGIPGTVGGGVATNAGIHEATVGDVVTRVDVLDAEGTRRSLLPADCGFRYRGSGLAESGMIVLEAVLSLSGSPFDREALVSRRRRSQPIGQRTAGCVFKNPSDVSAGALIERAGLKGFRVGGAAISSLHANFIINHGAATAAEVHKLIDIARRKVYKEYRVLLELEIEVVDG
jgi:UDP-N-acetylmuramate dehydrogenase